MICVNRDRERLVEDHLDVVRYEVAALLKRADVGHRVRLLGKDEALSIGNLALCEASKTFDFHRGVQFKTYAAASVRKSVLGAACAARHITNFDHEPTDFRHHRDLDKDFLQQQLPKLSSNEQAVVQLRNIQGLPWKDVAKNSGLSEVGSALAHRRAIEKLRLRAIDFSE